MLQLQKTKEQLCLYDTKHITTYSKHGESLGREMSHCFSKPEFNSDLTSHRNDVGGFSED